MERRKNGEQRELKRKGSEEVKETGRSSQRGKPLLHMEEERWDRKREEREKVGKTQRMKSKMWRAEMPGRK